MDTQPPNIGHKDTVLPPEGKLEPILQQFHEDIKNCATSPEKISEICKLIKEFDPSFEWNNDYSPDAEICLMANIVSGIYAPLIVSFCYTILKNVESGNLPKNLYIPPRDGYPLIAAMRVLSQNLGIEVNIIDLPVSRALAGIDNNQADGQAMQDPLLIEYLQQHIGECEGDIVEVETGIYGTLTLMMSLLFEEGEIDTSIIPIKMFGLGPTLSYFKSIFDNGNWNAEHNGDKFDADFNKWWMLLIDTLEEFGMSNLHKTVTQLERNESGEIVPVYDKAAQRDIDIAVATNRAVILAADKFSNNPEQLAAATRKILENVHILLNAANQGLPVLFRRAIESMGNKDEHFDNLRKRKQEAREFGSIKDPGNLETVI